MKKHFFNVIAALALVCGVFAFTGCADFESDINSINERLDALETGQIASLEEQIATLTSALDEAKGAIATLEGSVGDLDAAKEDLQSQIDELNTRIESNDGDIDKLVDQVADLEVEVARIDGLESDLENLKATVAEIEDKLADYATKEDLEEATLDIKGDIEDLNNSLGKLEGRVEALETSVEDLESGLGDLQGQIPGILEDIKAAQDSASSALGNIRSLREAFDVFTKNFDSKIEELELRDSTLMDNIDKLSDSLKANVSDLQGQIDQLKEELANKVNKDEFSDMVAEEIKKSIEAGYINDAISEAISELTEQINKQIGDVEKRIDDLTSDLVIIIGGLADNIQSLVFVPEYKDGMATSYYYTVAEKPLVDFQRVQATFQVTPAKLAASISNENAVLYVVPVKPETRAAAPAITVAGENLEIVADGSTGRIEVDAIVPITKEVGKDIAIALYVADEYVVNEAINNSDLGNIDLGNYVSSEYVQVNIDEKASALDDKYVLYNFTEEEEFPATLEVEKDWTMAPATVTFYEGYELAFDMAGDIVRLEEAAEALRLPVEAITPDYEPVVLYTPVMGNGVTISLDEEKGYGMIASMPATSEEAVKHVGDIAYVNNIFNINGKAVIENGTSYEIIPVTYELDLSLNLRTWPEGMIPWTYQLAKDHKILYKGTQEPLYLDEMLIDGWDEYQEEEGAFEYIDELLADGTPSFEKVLRTVEGGQPEDLTKEYNEHPEDGLTGYVTIEAKAFTEPVAKVTIDNYQFEKGKDVTYDVRKVYVNSDNTAKVIFNIDYTLGEMPVDREFNLAEEVGLDQLSIPFIASDMIEIILGEENKTYPYYKDITPMEWAYPAEGGFFKDFEDFRQSLYDNDAAEYGKARVYTVFTEKYNDDLRKWEPLEDYNGNPIAEDEVELLSNYWTFLSILNEPADAKEESIRVSSSNIAKIGDQFNFTATIETWYGVEYTFTTEAVIDAPSYSLIYVNAFAPGGIVDLRSHVDNQLNKYVIDPIDFSNYLQVEGTEGSDDVLKVKFERKTQWDPEHGYNHVPNPSPWAVRVDNATGILGSSTLDWNSGYTALDYDFEAVLYVEVRGQEIEVNRLPLTLNAIDPIALSADENISLTRPVGKNLVIKPWQYLTINGVVEFDGNKNNTEYKNLAQGPETTTNGEDIGNGPVEYWQITSINDGTLVPYGGELTFDSANMRLIYAASGTPVENQSKLYTYDPTLGIITFTNDFSSLAEDVKLIVPAKVTYTLDGGGVWSKTCDIEMNIPHERVTE